MKYFRLMIEYDEHEGNYLAVCRHYHSLFLTEKDVSDGLERALDVRRWRGRCEMLLPKTVFKALFCVHRAESPSIEHLRYADAV